MSLFRRPVSNAVGAAITDVSDPRSLRAENQRSACRPHTPEFWILLTDRVNAGICLGERSSQRRNDSIAGMFLIKVRDILDCFRTGFFPNSVPAHSVRDDEDVAAHLEPGGVNRRPCRASILVVAPFHAHISQRGEADSLKCRHKQAPGRDLTQPSYAIHGLSAVSRLEIYGPRGRVGLTLRLSVGIHPLFEGSP